MWLWERGKRTRVVNKKADFFGVRPGETCLIVLAEKHNAPGSSQRGDVRATVELAMLAGELGCDVLLESGAFRGSNGARTEFCVGGPLGGANVRTGGHLAAHLPGVTIHPFGSGPDSVAIAVGGERYRYDHDHQEYALVAKFTPAESSRPVVLVCGQSSLANQAAIHFLRREYASVAEGLESVDRFCLLIRISDIGTYAFHRTTLERDVTQAAFAPA
ncbi:hypothetical protein [Streptomyces sp. NPDC049040]|uniref:hypothetical protein n=1 Tax=Streptomyces sp. NPDC049040 TaxID=3365593 RepID=UPI00371CED4B